MNVRAAVVRRLAAVPLRVGLVVGVVALSAVVLLASGFAVTSALSKSLMTRTDEQLRDAAHDWAKPRPIGPSDIDGTRTGDQPRRFFELRKTTDGTAYFSVPSNESALPDQVETTPDKLETIGSTGGSSVEWRMLTISNQYGSTTIGLPLTDNLDTLSRLIIFEVTTGLIGLAVLSVGGYFVVRRGLRPLRRVEETAAAIAGGDLNRRVPVRGVDTEVDHLAQSLNVMLAQIQHGVSATEASEESARRSESRMRRFVADASHELRTPLTTIRGFAELYRQGAYRDPELVLKRVEAEAERMGLLVEDLLMLARLDAQRPLERTAVDLLALAGDAVHSARAIAARQQQDNDAPSRSISLEICPGTGTLEVPGDPARLRQVVANLLSNALAHTPPGTPITVRLTPATDEVRIDVADSGPGLAPEDATRVFERFYRTDASRTRSSGGSGLGLSIVQALVSAHGGQVSVASEPGQGATFTVVLPRAVPA